MYAKLIEGQIIPMHQPLKIGGKDTFTNDPAVILSQGYKPVIFTDPPAQEGFYATSAWAETEDAITQVWTLHEATPPEEPQIEP
jgi:hypothetical protein